jgi:hypothetical protein
MRAASRDGRLQMSGSSLLPVGSLDLPESLKFSKKLLVLFLVFLMIGVVLIDIDLLLPVLGVGLMLFISKKPELPCLVFAELPELIVLILVWCCRLVTI